MYTYLTADMKANTILTQSQENNNTDTNQLKNQDIKVFYLDCLICEGEERLPRASTPLASSPKNHPNIG